MNKKTVSKNDLSKGLKLLALLTAGAASGGCGLFTIGQAGALKIDAPAEPLTSESSSEAPVDAGQQDQQHLT